MRKTPIALPALAAAVTCLICCGSDDGASDREATEPAPEADRQSWNSILRLQGPQSTLSVRLPYAQDFHQRKITRGEGGVSIDFDDRAAGADADGGVHVQMRAQRMELEHDTDRIAVAGSVAVVTSDSVSLTTDSLRWSRADDLLRVPAWADVTRPGGSLRARDLSATTSLERWSAKNVTGALSGTTRDGAPYELQLRAKRDSSRRPRDGYLNAVYEVVSVRVGDRGIGGDLAHFDAEQGLITFSGNVAFEDPSRRIDADWLEHDLIGGASSASGTVVVEEGEWRLQAEVVSVDEDGNRWVSSGSPVVVDWVERSLKAAQIANDDRFEPAALVAIGDTAGVGQIEFLDGERLLTADSLTYHQDVERVEAAGAVVLAGPEFDGVVHARRINLSLDTEQAQLAGAPRLIRQRGADTLTMAAGVLTVDLAGRQVVGDDGFSVDTGTLALKAKRGHFDSRSERLTLSQGVEFIDRASDTILADSMVVNLEDGVVIDVLMPSPLTGSASTSETQASWFEAGSGHLLLDSERVQQIALTGNARVTHRNFERDAINRFTAADIEMNFTDGELSTVVAQGDAEVQSRLVDSEAGSAQDGTDSGSVNRVSGNRLDITIEDGVVRVRASDSVEGEFVPAPVKQAIPDGG